MGKHFGNLQRLYGVTYYCLSPTELRPFKGFFNPGVKNALRKIFYFGPPYVVLGGLAYFVYWKAKDTNRKIFMKNPDLYKNDV